MIKSLRRVVCVLAVLIVTGMTVCAADDGSITKNAVLQTNGDVELRDAPDETSSVTAALPAGTPVIVTEDAQNGWCRVKYRDNAGYIPASYLVQLGADVGISEEFEAAEEKGIQMHQEAVNAKKNMVSKKMWGAIIAVLVAAIFGVGILSARKRG